MYVRKFAVSIVLLLICVILVVSASFAWWSLSTAPEIMGIDTNIGSNGSLEIALLTDRTYIDPSLIQTYIGSSSDVVDTTVSNISWGNIVDLSNESYGLSKAALFPSRLNVTPNDSGGVVNSNMLSYAEYSRDGRFNSFTSDTVSGTYSNSMFAFNMANQSYGVRAIGSASSMSPQQSAYANAKSSVRSYSTAAKNALASVWSANGAQLLAIYSHRYGQGQSVFTNADVAVIRDTATRMTGVLSYVDSALRQGVIGYASAVISNEDTFMALRSAIEDTTVPLSVTVGNAGVPLPGNFEEWIRTVENGKVAARRAITGCDALSSGQYTWSDLSPLLAELLNSNKVYLNEDLLISPNAYIQKTMDDELTLIPGAGIMLDVADFVGNIDTYFTCEDKKSVRVTQYH